MDQTELMKTIGERVQMARSQAGMTQRELARAIGYSTNGVSKIERGLTEPHISALVQIARATKFPFWFMLPERLGKEDLEDEEFAAFTEDILKGAYLQFRIWQGEAEKGELVKKALRKHRKTTKEIAKARGYKVE